MKDAGTIAIVDYGVGNIYSLECSLQSLGFTTKVTADLNQLEKADRIILPGVGAFGDAVEKLQNAGLAEGVVQLAEGGKPLLGICLGMQLLFEKSIEFGEHNGLGLIPGQIVSIEDDLKPQGFTYKVPHMGWNPLQILKKNSPIMKYSHEGDFVYYVHSYYGKYCEESLVAASEYGIKITGVVQRNNVFGTQFHPEKSGKVGLAILQAFGEI